MPEQESPHGYLDSGYIECEHDLPVTRLVVERFGLLPNFVRHGEPLGEHYDLTACIDPSPAAAAVAERFLQLGWQIVEARPEIASALRLDPVPEAEVFAAVFDVTVQLPRLAMSDVEAALFESLSEKAAAEDVLDLLRLVAALSADPSG